MATAPAKTIAASARLVSPPRQRVRLRTLVELAVSLLVLVTLFRAFLASGYMIETGSMAPSLVGYHWQARCPSCRYPFAVEGTRNGRKATCPNCGQGGIGVERMPRNDGDHLLVHRSAFEFRPPERWEVVVFRNPNKATQAYVKRLIGLPGEKVGIRNGDISINGEIQAKSYATQRGMRINVFDNDFRPSADDADWQARWVAEEPDGRWTTDGGRFRYAPPPQSSLGNESLPPSTGGGRGGLVREVSRTRESATSDLSWVNYRHWVRRGGGHRTSVPLASWPKGVPLPDSVMDELTYDAAQGNLVCRGCLARDMRDRLLQGAGDPKFRQAIEKLYEASHIAPIGDRYGYNRGVGGGGEHELRDLMIEARVKTFDARGTFALELADGTETLQCVFDFTARNARLIDVRTGKTVRSADLSRTLFQNPAVVEMSLMDRQALVAVNGKVLFDPWGYPAGVERGPTPWQPVRFGASGAPLDIDAIKLFRDVYYTMGEGRRFVADERQLRRDEFFVLGDNSPLSRDSRSWPEETLLKGDLLLGKPLVVHLPSRKSRIRIGKWQTEIRIPEFSRIRYIY